jgi:release factor glutamine methyltransferase
MTLPSHPRPPLTATASPPEGERTARGLLRWATQVLSERNVESPRRNAEWMLENVLRTSGAVPAITLSTEQVSSLASMVARRGAREPLQYVLGETEFMGFRFRVDRRVFIPRPETEILVESVVKLVRDSRMKEAHILDIGTGSGNIAISLAKLLPHSRVSAADSSPDALEVARVNARVHGVEKRIELVEWDIFTGPERFGGERFHILASNPPYVPGAEYLFLQTEVRDFEPPVAVTDFGDGLLFYGAIAELGRRLLRPRGWLAVELAYNHHPRVERIFRESGYTDMETTLDYSGIRRVLRGRRG